METSLWCSIFESDQLTIHEYTPNSSMAMAMASLKKALIPEKRFPPGIASSEAPKRTARLQRGILKGWPEGNCPKDATQCNSANPKQRWSDNWGIPHLSQFWWKNMMNQCTWEHRIFKQTHMYICIWNMTTYVQLQIHIIGYIYHHVKYQSIPSQSRPFILNTKYI